MTFPKEDVSGLLSNCCKYVRANDEASLFLYTVADFCILEYTETVYGYSVRGQSGTSLFLGYPSNVFLQMEILCD